MPQRYTLAGDRGLLARETGKQSKDIKQQSELLKYIEVELTAAQILALNTTAATLVPAPGADKYLELESIVLMYNYGGTAYTIGSATNLQVKYTNNAGAAASATQAVTGMIDQATDQVRLLPQNGTAITPVVNAALVLGLAGANVTAGNGTITARVTYRVHSFA